MSDIIKRLGELSVTEDAFVTLSYSEGVDVWHINESHVEESVAETNTAAMLAKLLVSGLAVSDTYGDGDILAEMRDSGALDDYDRGDFSFEEYLTEVLVNTIYDGESRSHTQPLNMITSVDDAIFRLQCVFVLLS